MSKSTRLCYTTAPRICERSFKLSSHTPGAVAGRFLHSCSARSKSARLCSATAPHICERSFKQRSLMPGAVAERRRADFDIPVPQPQVCSHVCAVDTGGSAISLGQRWFGVCGFEENAENWVLGPFVAERILLTLRHRSATTYVWTHVMICVGANFPPASDRFRSAHVWTYLNDCWVSMATRRIDRIVRRLGTCALAQNINVT